MSQARTEFSAQQYESTYPDGGERHWWPLARNRIVRSVIERDAAPGAPILEIGCGPGVVVESLRAAGIDCHGVEPASVRPLPAAAGYIRTNMHATQLPESERCRYSTVLLLDVIEHLPDAGQFLREIDAAFPRLERVIVTVPARQELWSNYDSHFGHFRRYSLESLIDAGQAAGWEAQRASYFFHALYFPAWLVTRLRGSRATELTPPRGFMRLAHRLIAGLMLLDYYALPSRLPGSSLIASFRVGQ